MSGALRCGHSTTGSPIADPRVGSTDPDGAGPRATIVQEHTMTELHTLVTGLQMGESPRWHHERLWLCDWMAGQVLTVDADGRTEVVVEAPSFPCCIDPLPDGRLLLVSGGDGRLLRLEDDGDLTEVADLSPISSHPWNEVVADRRGGAYVDGIGFDMMGGAEPAPGQIAHVRADGTAHEVAGDLAFPNGMALTADGRTLLVAESHASRITAFTVADDGSLLHRRVWAEVAESAPDGVCLDADGALWFADVPNTRCVRVAEGGEVLQVVDLDRGGFSCALGGADGRTLFVVANRWGGDGIEAGEPGGVVFTTEVAVPGAAWA